MGEIGRNQYRKITIELVKEEFEKIGWELLSTFYKNAHQKLEYKCNNGHFNSITWNDFNNGYRCFECYHNSKRTDFNLVKNTIESEGYKLLSSKFKDVNTKLEIKCPQNHIFKLSFHKWKEGRRCQYCNHTARLSFDEVKNIIESENYKLHSKKYENNKSKLEVTCLEGHTYITTFRNWNSGYRCRTCDNISRIKYTEEDLLKREYYRRKISYESRRNAKNNQDVVNPTNLERGVFLNHIDHKLTVDEGFDNNIDYKIISNPYNLKMMWWRDNIVKSGKSEITLQELYIGYELYQFYKEIGWMK